MINFSQHIMKESQILEEEENIIKDVRNLFRLKKVKQRNNSYHN